MRQAGTAGYICTRLCIPASISASRPCSRRIANICTPNICADLGLAHILVDDAGLRLTGVIDFGDVRVGDPALDFTGLVGGLREDAIESYSRAADPTLLDRARRYRQIGPFHEVLYGIEIRNRAHIEAGPEGIRQRVLGKKHK